MKTAKGLPAVRAAMLVYLVMVVAGLVLLLRSDVLPGVVLVAAGHVLAWAFPRWHRRKYFAPSARTESAAGPQHGAPPASEA